MPDNLLQNIDNPQDNPITPETEATTAIKKLSKNPKIIVLIVLTSIILILLIAALLVSAAGNKKPPVKIIPTPTSITEIIEAPTPSPLTSQIPEEFQTQFNQIELEINKSENFLPPQIDIEIGIQKN